MHLDLECGQFQRRYKRFFADVERSDGSVVVSHLPNTGSMASLLHDNADAYIRFDGNPKRKLQWTLTLMGTVNGGLALVDTALPNRIVEEGILRGEVPELSGYEGLRREVRYGEQNSRIDILLEGADGPCYVEVKNCTMASTTHPGRADFPDSRTARGLKHLEEMTTLARNGIRAVQFYLVSRTDCTAFGLASEVDPAYAAAALVAQDAGVEFLSYRVELTPQEVRVGVRCPLSIT
jgi:sugar fermentation stimulation protein A